MYVDEPPKDGKIPDFNISKIDICPFRAYQRSFRLFQGDFSKDIHQQSRLLCFTQNDHTGHAGFKICPFLKWAQSYRTSIHLNKKGVQPTSKQRFQLYAFYYLLGFRFTDWSNLLDLLKDYHH